MRYNDNIILRLKREFTEDERTKMLFARYEQLLSLKDENEKAIENFVNARKRDRGIIETLRRENKNKKEKINNQKETILNLKKEVDKLKTQIREKIDPQISAYLKKFDDL